MQCSTKFEEQDCTSSQVFEEMKAAGNLKPTATTYGCLLMVCARQGDVDKAFLLYEEAYDTGVLATDECHNILIGICSDAGR
jgi:pentatricopeptide repeat protein